MRAWAYALLLSLLTLHSWPVAGGAQHGGDVGALLDPYVGAFRIEPRGTAAVSRFAHGARRIYLFTDFSYGLRGELVRVAGDTFDIVPRDGSGSISPSRVVLDADERGRPRLHILLNDRPARAATRVDLTTEAVEFTADGVRLAGEIVLPETAGPIPGIVFVHGSGPATRDDYREWSSYFAANGVGVLIYDKRGAGGSSGNLCAASFHDLANDAAAAVRRLGAHPQIDPASVGLSGGSQGAWVAPIAAELLEELAFLVPTGGGPITPAEQEIYRRSRIVQDSGYTATEIESARSLVKLYFDYLQSGGRDAALTRDVSDRWAGQRAAPWFSLLDLPDQDPTVDPWPEDRRRFAEALGFDARPFMRSIRSPTLAILGADDQVFPTEPTARSYRTTVPPSLLTLWIIPDVDHGFWVTDDPARGRHQSPELFEGMLRWICRQVAAECR